MSTHGSPPRQPATNPQTATSRGRSLSPRLRPAQWGTPGQPTSVSPGGATAHAGTTTIGSNDHWTLKETVDAAKFHHLFRLPHKLSASNYVTWITMIESTLDTADLFEYCTGHVQQPSSSDVDGTLRWRRANALVRAVLTTNMTEEVVNQVSHLKVASAIWREARRLFAGQTTTDWTLIITNLVTTKYVDGEDLPAHIAKMKSFRRDLILMNRNIDDDLFACFLRISMPGSWNYVFAALPDRYTAEEVERRIKDELGIRTNQLSNATAYQATGKVWSKGKRDKERRSPRPGEPVCSNCGAPGHTVRDCWSKGGGAEGKGPRQ